MIICLFLDNLNKFYPRPRRRRKEEKECSNSLQARRFKITQRTQKRFSGHTLVNLCEISRLPLTRSVCRHALLCPRHRSIQRSLGGPPQREHLRSNDPGVGHGLNSSKFVKSLPLSGLSSTSHRMRLFSRQKSIPRAFGSAQCRVISG